MIASFTDRAKRVMQLADEEVHRFGRETIGVEHILLGLCKEGTGVGASVLAAVCNADLSNIVLQIEQIVEPSHLAVTSDKLPLNDCAKKALTYALQESEHLNHNWVGTEHLLLGLSRVSEGVVADVFQQFGISHDEVRKETLVFLGEMPLQKVIERGLGQQIRQAVELCWNMLPSDQKNLEQLEVAMGRIVKQELAKFRETNPPFDVSSSH